MKKPNYEELISNNPTINEIKKRVNSKVSKYWGKKYSNEFLTLADLIKRPRGRQNIYMSVYLTRLERKNEHKPLPNAVLINLLIQKLGHWSSRGRGFKTPKKGLLKTA